jgi:zinc and cadmium transporter
VEVWIYTLASVALVSLVSLAGIFLLRISLPGNRHVLLFLVSFSVGGLFGDSFIHLLPEAYESLPGRLTAPLAVIVGILSFFVLEKFLCWRHCHIPTSDDHPHHLAWINVVGDAFHNFIDGVIIGATYQADLRVGLGTTLAVILHEIPQEIGDYGVLLYAGLSRRQALAYNFLGALMAIAGAILALLAGPHLGQAAAYVMPFAAGGFIYMAGSDLIPELQRETNPGRSVMQFLAIVLGVAVMALLLLVD